MTYIVRTSHKAAGSTLNLSMVAGETKTITVQVLQSEGTPLDLTGYSIAWAMEAVLSKSTAAATITVAAPATLGTFSFTLTSAQTTPLGSNTAYRHECKIKEIATSVVTQVFEGYVLVEPTLVTL